jgi:Cu2+-exporting ATPase
MALATMIYWGLTAPDRAIWTTLAVLIATCPCALSLATPAALASATHGLAEAGLLVTRGHVLEGLASAQRIVLDKTGTLTRGEPSLVEIRTLRPDFDRAACLRLARQLEHHSEHPLARALRTSDLDATTPLVCAPAPGEVESVVGSGIEARMEGVRTRIGRPDWVLALAAGSASTDSPGDTAHTWVLLGDERGPIGWLGFGDEVRAGAEEGLSGLRALGLSLEMLSGDPSPAAPALAERLGLEVVQPGASPSEKVARIRALQQAGERVIVVGDGVNDGPVLAAAPVSIAMGSGSDLTRLGADAILMRDDLALLPRAIGWSRRVRRVIRQNLAWAIGYNVVALPLALSGQLPPWLAAAGMSASSLVVVLNAMRLHRGPDPAR